MVVIFYTFTNEMPKIGQIRIIDRRLLFFPGRFSTCNLVFGVSGGRPLQQNLFEKNRINIYIRLQTLSLNVT